VCPVFADIEDGRPGGEAKKREAAATLNRGAKIGGGGDSAVSVV
jgi:hypothetical protein